MRQQERPQCFQPASVKYLADMLLCGICCTNSFDRAVPWCRVECSRSESRHAWGFWYRKLSCKIVRRHSHKPFDIAKSQLSATSSRNCLYSLHNSAGGVSSTVAHAHSFSSPGGPVGLSRLYDPKEGWRTAAGHAGRSCLTRPGVPAAVVPPSAT